MKHITITLIALLFSISFVNAQGTIISITHSPESPTTTDTVYFYVALQFTSSGCVVDFQDATVSGTTITASSQHCMGFLAAICDITDTFKINPLDAGTYTFDYTLASGIGETPCSPGIIPDDNDTISFTVTGTTVGIEELGKNQLAIYPNPVQDQLTIGFLGSQIELLTVSTVTGEVILEQKYPSNKIDVSHLSKGVYVLRLTIEGREKTGKFLKE